MERPRESVVPEPQPFDPARSAAPTLPATDDGSPGVVLLVVATAAREHEWAERVAAQLAASWSDQGRRILLADFALARPGLHHVLQVGNGEGVTDAFLFGSSVQRVAQPVQDGRFLFMPAGTATARPDQVTASPRWAAIIEACASVRATLVAFLPSDLPGGEALLRWASDVLLLTDPAAVRHEGLARGLGPRLRAVLVPVNGSTRPAAAPVAAAVAAVVEPPPPPPPPVVEAEPDEAEEWSEPLPLIAPDEPPAAAASAPVDPWAEAGEVPAEPDEDEVEDSAPLPMLDVDVSIDTPAEAEAAEQDDWLPLLPGTEEPEASDDPLALSGFDDEPMEDSAPLPMLDDASAAPTGTVEDPWAETEVEHERSAPGVTSESGEGEPGFAIDLGMPEGSDAESEAAVAAGSGADAAGGPENLDFGDLQSSANPMMPEPVTPEQEKEAAALFDLAAFDGMVVEDAAPPPPRQPVILESEEEPIVLPGATPSPPPRPTSTPSSDDEAPAGFDMAGELEAAPEAPPARPTTPRPPRPTPAGAEGRAIAKPTPKPAESAKGNLIGLGVMLALLAVVALAWFEVVEIPWLSDFLAARRAPPAESSAPAPSVLAAEAPNPDVLGASLTLGAFTDLPVARLQAEALAEQRPDLLFVVAPLEVDGVVYHRLLAGPARDSVEAALLRTRLATVLTRENPDSWELQRTPLAFELGETDDKEAARARVEALSRVDIPAYVLELPAPTPARGFVRVSSRVGAARYRVYAGAYADAHEAAYLADLIARHGETQARLIERTGRHIE